MYLNYQITRRRTPQQSTQAQKGHNILIGESMALVFLNL
jgi:hypothetical protein